MSTPAAERARLIAIIRQRSYGTGVEIKLASGRTSNFYFNMKPTMLHPEGAWLIGRLVCAAIGPGGADLVGGLEMGAVPIATTTAAASHMGGRPMPAFFVRKQAKGHGTQNLIEGLGPGETVRDKRIVVLEDVTTTGGSAMKAIEAIRDAGGRIERVITVVDREEGAADTFAAAGLTFAPILRASDFR